MNLASKQTRPCVAESLSPYSARIWEESEGKVGGVRVGVGGGWVDGWGCGGFITNQGPSPSARAHTPLA